MNRKRWLASLLGALLLAATAMPVGAGGDVTELEPLTPAPIFESDEMMDESPTAWFVELAGAPASDGGAKGALKQERDSFKANAKKAGQNLVIRHEYESLFNGFSIRADRAQVAELARIPGVKAIYPVMQIDRPEVGAGDELDLYTAIAMTGADVVQSEMGYTGKGIKVAVMDTGVDYDHPDLGGCFGPGCRVVTGWDFVGDAFNADPASPNFNPVPVPDRFPDDCQGHGTHVAGIIGANGRVRGVAPDVTFGAYRVFGCEGSTTADIMLAAMERAQADGMQVLNMSIGSSFQWPQYPTAVASDRLVKKGMVVVASIGNSGANGLYAAGAPGVGERVIGVASFENSHIAMPIFTASPGGERVGYVQATAAPHAPTTGTYSMARTGTKTSVADGCSPLPAGSLAGKVALIRRGTCPFYDKALYAQRAGAAGVVLYNNAAGMLNPTVAGTVAITIPVVMVSQAQGNLLDTLLSQGAVEMSWSDEMDSFPNSLGGTIASSSSYGLAADLSLKPDIGAPGANIYSTYPLEAGGYATLSGTSMASPHVAGAAALLLQARPKSSPQEVTTLLQNTALPKNWWGNPGLGFLDNVHRQGAGMLQIDRAIQATSTVEPSKLSLGESEGGSYTRTLTIENRGKDSVTYQISHAPALSTGPNTFTVQTLTGFSTASFSPESLTIKGGQKRNIQVTITPNPGLPDGSIFGGYIVVTPSGGGDPMRVPYAGFKGDYQGITALAPTIYGLPWLSVLEGGSYYPADEGESFTMQNGDMPYIIYHLDHQVQRLQVDVLNEKGQSQHLAADQEWLGRNSTPTGIYAFAFDGTTKTGNKVHVLPNGTYVLVLKVLKAGGKHNNPDHWETWTSPSFTIDRP